MQADVACDLGARWPWPDSSVDEALAEHVLEHLPGDTFFNFFREMWRVGKPGAKLNVLLPHPRHDIFLNDPTHVRPVLPATLIGFSKRHLAALEKQDIFISPLWQIHGVDFDCGSVRYYFDQGVDKSDPELEWKMKHLFNIIAMWGTTMTVVK